MSRAQRQLIVLLGPDGCGKTTISELLAKQLAAATGSRPTLMSFRFGVLPSLSRLRGRPDPQGSDGNRPLSGMGKPQPMVRAIVLALWYGFDHVLGRVKLLTNTDTVIFARSYHDFLFQRAYRHAPNWLVRTFLALGPKPSHIIALRRSPIEIFSQKPELSVDEIQLQYDLIQRRLAYHRKYSEIDANRGVDATLALVIAKVLG